MSIDPTEIAPAVDIPRTLQPAVRTRKKVPVHSDMYRDKTECLNSISIKKRGSKNMRRGN
jgi:hypothetical protein